jgi:hypothetical protein
MTARVRCAVYTRKSSEEGLEQSFNSLDAQREACEAYILSQRHEGWHVVPTRYDDGGFSGGNMERPGLKKLLDDIAAKRVDTVVVYKVDRLTRSLADFAKIVEQFDKQGISFVSVTRQFNTTTSMGRLTLKCTLILCAVIFVFLQGVLGKTGVWTWFFDGKCAVDRGGFVVNGWSYFGVEKYATGSVFIFWDSRFGNGLRGRFLWIFVGWPSVLLGMVKIMRGWEHG